MNAEMIRVDVEIKSKGDGKLVPLKISFVDEHGQKRTFIVKRYSNVSHQGTGVRPDGVFVTDKTVAFECLADEKGKERRVNLYNILGVWMITMPE